MNLRHKRRSAQVKTHTAIRPCLSKSTRHPHDKRIAHAGRHSSRVRIPTQKLGGIPTSNKGPGVGMLIQEEKVKNLGTSGSLSRTPQKAVRRRERPIPLRDFVVEGDNPKDFKDNPKTGHQSYTGRPRVDNLGNTERLTRTPQKSARRRERPVPLKDFIFDGDNPKHFEDNLEGERWSYTRRRQGWSSTRGEGCTASSSKGLYYRQGRGLIHRLYIVSQAVHER
jgi:hypothetical protein